MNDWFRVFGQTGLKVSALGFGAGHIGGPNHNEAEIGKLLNRCLDLGITLMDTARGYGQSEERIGRHLSHRRSEFILSTKVGYDIPGYTNWTGPIIGAGVQAALQRLKTDYLDIVHLHSCPKETLEQGEVVGALNEEVRAGRVRVAAYSGDNDPLDWAVASGRFHSIECSINIADQRVIDGALALAAKRGLGVIAKRPVANAPWRFRERPVGHYCEVYWDRLHAMDLDPGGLDWTELALRFVAFLPGVHSCIVGSHSIKHMERNVELVRKGPLAKEQMEAIRAAFRRHDRDWTGQV